MLVERVARASRRASQSVKASCDAVCGRRLELRFNLSQLHRATRRLATCLQREGVVCDLVEIGRSVLGDVCCTKEDLAAR